MYKRIATCMLLIALPLVSMLGCDSKSPDGSSNDDTRSSTGSPAKPAAVDGQAGAPLGEAPFDLDAALGRVRPVANEIDACPFLTDESAKSTVKTHYDLVRRYVSNSECRWSYNAGFSIEVSLIPIDQSNPVEQRRYNLGVETKLEPQSGPGENAVLVSDTAWDKALPFGYGFELDNQAIFIHVTGFPTDAARLKKTANDIAQSLPLSPEIEAQWRTESVSFDPCSLWQDQAIQSALGLSDYGPVNSHASGNSCSYKAFRLDTNKSITLSVRFEELDLKYYSKALERGHEDLPGYGFPVTTTIEASSFGTYTKIVGYIDGGAIDLFILDENNSEHRELTQSLLRNLATRLRS